MRIYKGNIGFEMTVQSFLDLLEVDALEEIAETISMLEQEGSFFSAADLQDDELEAMEVMDGMMFLGNLTEEELKDLLNFENMEVLTQEEFEEVYLPGAVRTPETAMSDEDLRVKRIADRFGWSCDEQ